MTFLINWSISELNTQVNPTTCLGDTDCWNQQSVPPKQVVEFTCAFNSEIDQLVRNALVPPDATAAAVSAGWSVFFLVDATDSQVTFKV